MSVNEGQPHHYDIQAGLALFHNHVAHQTTLDGEEKSNDRPTERKDSTTATPTPPSPKTAQTSNVKLVGSNRFVLLHERNSYLVIFFIRRFFIPVKK